MRLRHGRFGQATRLPLRPPHDVQAVERRESEPAAVGGGHGVADLADGEGRGVLDGVLELDLGSHRELLPHPERDLDRVSPVDGKSPDPASVGGQDLSRVRCEVHPGQHVAIGDRLLVVALDGIAEPALVSRLEVSDAQPGLVLVTRSVDEPSPVRGDRGPEGRAVARGPGVRLAGLAIVDRELVLGKRRVVLPASVAARVPDVAAVRREGRAHGLELFGLRSEDLAAPSVDVPEPQLHGPQTRVAPRGGDVGAVGRPLRGHPQVAVALRDLRRVAGRDVERPEVGPAAPVRHEEDLRAVRAEARLRVEGHPLGDPRGRAALEGKREQVAEHVEDQRAAVGAHVEREPGAFVGIEEDGAGGLERQAPVLRLIPAPRGGRLRERRR